MVWLETNEMEAGMAVDYERLGQPQCSAPYVCIYIHVCKDVVSNVAVGDVKLASC